MVSTRCNQCNQPFKRPARRYNEAVKNKWKQFCSLSCLQKSKVRVKKYVCSNPCCLKSFLRLPSHIEPSGNTFCSRHCAAVFRNHNRRKSKPKCMRVECQNLVTDKNSHAKYCSLKCAARTRVRSKQSYKDGILQFLQRFVKDNQRIPLKAEAINYNRIARQAFGTWNNAIIAAGLTPNPVMFANRHVALDGHICDSLSEKVLDDWLSNRKIAHQVHVPYPFENGMKSDFKVGDYWIELFGLEGQHNKYDHLKERKLILAKKLNLKMITFSLKDVYSPETLRTKLNPILKNAP